MTIPGSANPLLLKAPAGGGGGEYTIERSVRFNSADSAYLSRTPASAGNRKTWTWAGWVKRSVFTRGVLFASTLNATNIFAIEVNPDKLDVYDFVTTHQWRLETTAVFRDPSAWMHICFALDTTQATSANRAKLYVNGIQVSTFDTASYPSLDHQGFVNTTNVHDICSYGNGTGLFFNGYLADIHFIDGQALDPTSFGEFDANGIWQPIAYTGDYGFVSVADATGALPIYNTTDTHGAVKETGTRTDANASSLVLALPLVGNADDVSNQINSGSTTKTITASGDAAASSAQSKFYGGSYYFDGAGDFLTVADNADFNFGSDDFTIEFWFYPVTLPLGNKMLVDMRAPGLSSVPTIYTASGELSYYTDSLNRITGSLLSAGQWYHIALSRSGTATKMFLNGTQDGSTYSDSVNYSQSAVYVCEYFGGGYASNGYIQDLRIYKGVAKYTTNFTVASGPNNSFHLPFSDNSTAAALGTDTSGNGNDWTVNNISNVDISELIYAGNATAAVDGVVPNGGTPYWIDILPTTADLAYSGGPGMDVVHDGNLSTFVYWVGDDYASGNVTQARFDLRDFPTVTSVRVYAEQPFTGGAYTPYSARLLDAGKSVIAGSSVTINSTSPAWHNLAVSGSPRYIEFYRVSPINERLNLHAIEVNGQILTDIPASTSDSLVDVPTNGSETDTGVGGEVRGNYCTLNPLSITYGSGTLANGNLELTPAGSDWTNVNSTFAITSEKVYFEATGTDTPSSSRSDNARGAWIGLRRIKSQSNWAKNGTDAYSLTLNDMGYLKNGGSTFDVIGAKISSGDVVGFAYDGTNGTYEIFLNGVSKSSGSVSITSYSAGDEMYVATAAYPDSGTVYGNFALNFGQRPFAYTAPSGFKALCTANLPAPVVTNPSEYMDILLWTGDGSASRSISLPISGDLVWAKKRSATNSHQIADTVRGDNAVLLPNGTNAESDPVTDFVGGGISSITATEFVISQGTSDNNNLNLLNGTHVAWTWDAGSNSSKTYTVTVPGGIGGGFYIDGDQKPTINLEEGSTYTFDQSDSSNSGHPFKFSETSDGTHGAGTEYTTNVTTFGTPGSAGAYTRIEVAASAPTLYYYCSNHSAMGGQINTNSTAGASNFDGSIPSVVRANASAGFSIVTYTGTGSNATVGHGLGVQPQFLIIKCRDTAGDQSWIVSHTSIGLGSGRLILNSTQANSTNGDSVLWNSTAPTSSVFSLGNYSAVNGSTLKYVAYCFAPVEGYSAFGSYTGNGSADGPYVFTNHRPRWILLKRTDTTSNWTIIDTAREGYNVDNDPLYANLSDAEGTTDLADILSNGFKLRSTDASVNANAGTYIFASFAEQPFSLARAR